MKHEEKWHSWPEEIPPEAVVLRVEVWNEYREAFERGIGVFWKGEFFHPDFENLYDDYGQCLFNGCVEKVYWRLWEDEECSH